MPFDQKNEETHSQIMRFTNEGGIAVPFYNQTGGVSVRGTCVSLSAPWTVAKTTLNVPDCMGIVYEDGTPVGEKMWVVISGITPVLFSTAVTAGFFARTPITADGGTAGSAISEVISTTPFANDKFMCEIGHCIETKAAPGLANVNLHFN